MKKNMPLSSKIEMRNCERREKQDKMKICIAATTANCLRSFALEPAKYFYEKEGWDIVFVCNDDGKISNELPKNTRFYPISMRRGISLSGFKSIIQFIMLFKREQFDLVQYSTPNASLYAAIASRLVGIPARLYCQWGIIYTTRKGLARVILKLEEKLVCKLSTRIEPDSFGNQEFSCDEGLYEKEKSSVIWNGSACGIDLTKFNACYREQYSKDVRSELGIREDAFVVGYVGRITRDKGSNELLEAFQRLIKRYDEMQLLMVGEIDFNAHMNEELLYWSKTDCHVYYISWSNVVEKYLAAMDVFAFPSYREGFGQVVIESEAMGTPVIVTDIIGPTEAMVNGETGAVIPVKSVDDLYNIIEKMYLDYDRRKEMGKNAVGFVKNNFDRSIFLNHLLEDRKELLKKSKSRRRGH